MDPHDRETLRRIVEGLQAETWRLRGRAEAMGCLVEWMLMTMYQHEGTAKSLALQRRVAAIGLLLAAATLVTLAQ